MFSQIRKGIIQAQFDTKSFNVLVGEIFIVTVLLGIGFHSWLMFGLSFLAFIILISLPQTAGPIIFAFSFIWGLIAFDIGFFVCGGGFGGFIGGIVFGAIGFLMGLGIHLSAVQYSQDL